MADADTNLAADPLAAVPMIPAGVEHVADSAGGLQLRRAIAPCGALSRAVSRAFGMRYYRRARLDELGSLFWRQIDGVRTVREIARRIAAETKLPEDDAARATVAYIATLMRRELLALQVTGAAP